MICRPAILAAGGRSSLYTNLVAAWPLYTNSNDASGNGNNGTDVNMTYAGGAAQFDGTGHIHVADSDAFTFGNGEWAISLKVKRGALSSRQLIFGQSNSAGQDGSISVIAEFSAIDALLIGVTTTPPATVVSAAGTFTDTSAFYHIVIQRKVNDLEIYVNGSLNNSHPIFSTGESINNSSNDWGIGAGGEITSLYFEGEIKDKYLWVGRSLTASEITDLQTKSYPF